MDRHRDRRPEPNGASGLSPASLHRYYVAAGIGAARAGPVQAAAAMTGLNATEAAARILAEVRRQPALRVPLDDALGSVLAESVVSPVDIPAWTNSAVDGYAVRGAEVRGATQAVPKRLRVVEAIPAGKFPTRVLGPGECARIFTGAPLPQGADSVIRQEDTDLGGETVAIYKDR